MEREKTTKKIIYGSCQGPKSHRKTRPMSDPLKYQHSVQFEFRDYLKLVIAKVFPTRGVNIVPQEHLVVGKAEKCEPFMERAYSALEKYAFRLVKFNQAADVDEIDFALSPHYGAKIIRTGVLLKVLELLGCYEYLANQAQQMRDKLRAEQNLLVQVPNKYKRECFEEIDSILRGKPHVRTRHRFLGNNGKGEHSSEDEEVEESGVNFYQMGMKQQLRQASLRQMTSSDINESTLVLTQQSEEDRTQQQFHSILHPEDDD